MFWPIAPLLDMIDPSPYQACKNLGLSGTTMKIYRERGVSTIVADRLAIRAGFHPWEVWPDMGEHSMAEAERAERAAELARKRRYMERRRQDPDYRAWEAERQRAYRGSMGEAARRADRVLGRERERRYRERKRAA